MIGKPPPPTATPGVDETALAEAHRRLLTDSSIQFNLPAVEPPQTPGWAKAIAEFIQAILPALKILFWAALALLALYILYGIAMWLMGKEWPRWRRKAKSEAAADDDWRPEAAPARALLQEADALAAQGRYAEAAHLILFRSIEDIEGRRPSLLAPALTSRDIAALAAIPERPRGAFARIAMLVERSLFAARPLGEGDWRDCRAAYEEFAFAGAWAR
jgi:hypothetical protein